jgi:hypothetical protein
MRKPEQTASPYIHIKVFVYSMTKMLNSGQMGMELSDTCMLVARHRVYDIFKLLIFEVEWTLKNGVFWDITPCGSCKN